MLHREHLVLTASQGEDGLPTRTKTTVAMPWRFVNQRVYVEDILNVRLHSLKRHEVDLRVRIVYLLYQGASQ